MEHEPMELRGKRILLFSPEPWEGLHMSKHHLSQALAARGNSVYFLDPPRPGNTGFSSEEKNGVTVLRYKHWLRGVNRLPTAINRWYYKRLIRSLAQRTGGPFDIIWCFDTSRMQAFPEGVGMKLLHLADYDILYTGQGLIPTADLVLTTCQVVADEVAPRATAQVLNVGHALDARWLVGIDTLAERDARPVRNMVFSGQLANSYNDWEGFLELASSHPELQFTFIGPFDPGFPEPAFHALRKLENVRFAGLVGKDELVPLVREADMLFFGFRSAQRAKERANPHKVLEYLSTGNVIVGSYTMEYKDGNDLFTMAPEGGNLREAFDRALHDHAALNTKEQRAHRIAFARSRTMNDLIGRIEKAVAR
ncbi:MAG: hypothetical protein IPI81_13780 [Flavobacteriales bacterium]|nr:hypothetical protein [Flavobacteriales bacterium]MCC6937372.1 hypothetical protein [Flavobacteriales bacterium]